MFDVLKINEDDNLVFGWASVAINKTGDVVVDQADEVIDIEDLEMAAYAFNLIFRKSGANHKGDANGSLVESMVFTEEKLKMLGLEKGSINEGWWVGFHIEDDNEFAKIKKGDYNMFSIQGKALREEVK